MSLNLKSILSLRKNEGPFTLYMFLYFFFVIVTFWILKPIRKALFIEFYDQAGFQFLGNLLTASQTELLAKVTNMAIAIGGMILFSLASRFFKKEKLTYLFISFFVLADLVFAFWLRGDSSSILVWSLYLFGDLFIMIMLSAFFGFLNDSVNADEGKRLYGFVVLGGVIGGVVGTTLLSSLIDVVPDSGWLLVCAAVGFCISLTAYKASQHAPHRKESEVEEQSDQKKKAASVFSGAQLVFKQKYLLALFSIVALYEIVSQVMDFQFSSSVSHYLDGSAIGQHFATVYTITNILSCVIQIFITPWLLQKSIRQSLFVFPFLVLAASAGFLAFPILWIASLMPMIDNAINYSLNQSARENLYVPLSQSEKYEVKAFIDIFGVRFAKSIAIFISLIITSYFSGFATVRWLSLGIVPMAILWLIAANYLGKEYKSRTSES